MLTSKDGSTRKAKKRQDQIQITWIFQYEQDTPYLPLTSVLAMEHCFIGGSKGWNITIHPLALWTLLVFPLSLKTFGELQWKQSKKETRKCGHNGNCEMQTVGLHLFCHEISLGHWYSRKNILWNLMTTKYLVLDGS